MAYMAPKDVTFLLLFRPWLRDAHATARSGTSWRRESPLAPSSGAAVLACRKLRGAAA